MVGPADQAAGELLPGQEHDDKKIIWLQAMARNQICS
jgi:hypothetical protein